jgi:hypothetical protein
VVFYGTYVFVACTSPVRRLGRSVPISRIAIIAGDHSMLVTRLIRGRRAGRYALAYKFFDKWRFVTDVDTDELLTWKTQEEALIIGEAWRTAWETLRLPAPEKYPLSARSRPRHA